MTAAQALACLSWAIPQAKWHQLSETIGFWELHVYARTGIGVEEAMMMNAGCIGWIEPVHDAFIHCDV